MQKNQAEMSKTDAYLLRNDFRGDLVAWGNEDWASIHMKFFDSKVIIIYDEREIFLALHFVKRVTNIIGSLQKYYIY